MSVKNTSFTRHFSSGSSASSLLKRA
uniref:Uncharacterized protein n=1 Tax=Anguilla anguilla TaxID=7936 RepID=A0A0E9QLI2_ANGAN